MGLSQDIASSIAASSASSVARDLTGLGGGGGGSGPSYGVPLLGIVDNGETLNLGTSTPAAFALKNPAIDGNALAYIDYDAPLGHTVNMGTTAEISTGVKDAGSNYGYLTGLAFSDDGTRNYGVLGAGGGGSGQFYERTLTTPWSIAGGISGSNVAAVSLGTLLGTGDLYGMALSPDGLHGYTLAGNRTVYHFEFNTAYDVDDLSYSSDTLATGSAGTGTDLDITPDGLYLIVLFRSTTVNACEVYALTTPWDLSTATLSHTVDLDSLNAALTIQVNAVAVDTVNKVFYLAEGLTDTIYQYSWTGVAS